MNKKKIFQSIIFIILFMLVLPGISIAAGVNWSWRDVTDSSIGSASRSFDDYASGKFKFKFRKRNTTGWTDPTNSQFWVANVDLRNQEYKRIFTNDEDATFDLNVNYYRKYKILEANKVPNDVEAYIMSFADINNNDSIHETAQMAWWAYQKNTVPTGNTIFNNAHEYASWIEMLEGKLDTLTSGRVQDIASATDQELQSVIEDSYSLDTDDSVVSVIHEDKDYILISGIKTYSGQLDEAEHYCPPDDDGNCKGCQYTVPYGLITQINIKFKDGKSIVLNPGDAVYSDGVVSGFKDEDDNSLDDKVVLEFKDKRTHESKSKSIYQSIGTCDHENHRKHNTEHYPFPFPDEEFNLKFSSDYVIDNNITGVAEISIATNSSRGILKGLYTELDQATDADLTQGEKDAGISGTELNEEFFDPSSVVSYDYYYETANLTTRTALGLEDTTTETNETTSTKQMLAMSEKTAEEYTQLAAFAPFAPPEISIGNSFVSTANAGNTIIKNDSGFSTNGEDEIYYEDMNTIALNLGVLRGTSIKVTASSGIDVDYDILDSDAFDGPVGGTVANYELSISDVVEIYDCIVITIEYKYDKVPAHTREINVQPSLNLIYSEYLSLYYEFNDNQNNKDELEEIKEKVANLEKSASSLYSDDDIYDKIKSLNADLKDSEEIVDEKDQYGDGEFKLMESGDLNDIDAETHGTVLCHDRYGNYRVEGDKIYYKPGKAEWTQLRIKGNYEIADNDPIRSYNLDGKESDYSNDGTLDYGTIYIDVKELWNSGVKTFETTIKFNKEHTFTVMPDDIECSCSYNNSILNSDYLNGMLSSDNITELNNVITEISDTMAKGCLVHPETFKCGTKTLQEWQNALKARVTWLEADHATAITGLSGAVEVKAGYNAANGRKIYYFLPENITLQGDMIVVTLKLGEGGKATEYYKSGSTHENAEELYTGLNGDNTELYVYVKKSALDENTVIRVYYKTEETKGAEITITRKQDLSNISNVVGTGDNNEEIDFTINTYSSGEANVLKVSSTEIKDNTLYIYAIANSVSSNLSITSVILKGIDGQEHWLDPSNSNISLSVDDKNVTITIPNMADYSKNYAKISINYKNGETGGTINLTNNNANAVEKLVDNSNDVFSDGAKLEPDGADPNVYAQAYGKVADKDFNEYSLEIKGLAWSNNDLKIELADNCKDFVTAAYEASTTKKEGWQEQTYKDNNSVWYNVNSGFTVADRIITLPGYKEKVLNGINQLHLLLKAQNDYAPGINISFVGKNGGGCYSKKDGDYQLIGTTYDPNYTLIFSNDEFCEVDDENNLVTFTINYKDNLTEEDYDLYISDSAKKSFGITDSSWEIKKNGDTNTLTINVRKDLIQGIRDTLYLEIKTNKKQESNSENDIVIAGISIQYLGEIQIVSYVSGAMDGFVYNIYNESPLLRFNFDYEKLYPNGVIRAPANEEVQNQDELPSVMASLRDYDIQFPVITELTDYKLTKVKVNDKEVTATVRTLEDGEEWERFECDVDGGLTFSCGYPSVRDGQTYIRMNQALPYFGYVKYVFTFSKDGEDPINVELSITREDVEINTVKLEKGVNVWNTGATDDPEYEGTDNDVITIMDTSDGVYNNLNIAKYFECNDKINGDSNENVNNNLTDYTSFQGGEPLNLSLANSDIEVIKINKKGFIKEGDKYYINLNFKFEDAISYEINYRYLRQFYRVGIPTGTYIDNTYYAGDGYDGQMLYLKEINGDGIEKDGFDCVTTVNNDGTLGSTVATFRVARAGFSAITIRFTDNRVKNIFIYVPPMYVGELTNDSGTSEFEDHDEEWHTEDSGLLNRAAQFYVDLKNRYNKQELVFYNISGNISLSDSVMYPIEEGGVLTNSDPPYVGSKQNWMTSKDMWDKYGESSTLNREFQDDGSGTNVGISEIYYLDGVGKIVGFHNNTSYGADDVPEYDGDNTGVNPITANYYLNTSTNSHELRWSFRDTGLLEEGEDSEGSTLFTIIFREGNISPGGTPGGGGSGGGSSSGTVSDEADFIYIQSISEYKPDSTLSVSVPNAPGQWDFTMTISGKGWIDDENIQKTSDNPYGLWSGSGADTAIPDNEVTVVLEEYDINGNLIGEKFRSQMTQSSGNYSTYSFDNILPPLSTDNTEHYYSVKFIYDGQKYEATEFLATSGVDIDNLNGNSISDRVSDIEGITPPINGTGSYERYADSSWAVEIGRDTFDNELDEITATGPVTDTGQSTIAKSQSGVTPVYQFDDGRPILNTTHLIEASTKEAGLTIPIKESDPYHLKNLDFGSVSVKRPSGTERHVPISEYSKMINFGLVKRDESDLSVARDVYKAKVVINEQELDYRYNQLVILPVDGDGNISVLQKEYNLGLFNSDINYSSKVYENAAQAIQAIKASTELRAFITYRIALYNESANTKASVKELSEYYLNTNGFTLVKDDTYANILVKTGNNLEDNTNYDLVRESRRVAESSYYRIITDGSYNYYYDKEDDIEGYTNGSVTWVDSSSVGDYNKFTTDSLTGIYLDPGDRLEVFVTYEVDRDGFEEAVNGAITLNENGDSPRKDKLTGDKITVSEISKYSTEYYRRKHNTTSYSVGQNSGKLDRDSVAGNINFNNTDYFEDDTCTAPTLSVEVTAEEREYRSISGTVWEDSWEEPETNGDGINNGETGIDGIDVSLIEKIVVEENGEKNEYEFAWPIIIEEDNNNNNNHTGTCTTDDTEQYVISTADGGKYQFNNIVPGTYVVRFEYGSDNQNGDYSGQDYKNTDYQTGFDNLQNEWHDIGNENLNNALVSDARDYEPQRLRVIAYSRTISNENGEVLAGENSENTYMVANTAKINIEPEVQGQVDYTSGKDGQYVKTTVEDGVFRHNYAITNIDFGLEKRPETKLELDKELTEITLTKNDDSSVIFNAKISKVDGEIVIDRENGVATDKIMSINSEGATQGFHYITIEDSYLNNLSVKLDYNITVTNNSDTDYVGQDLAVLTKMEDIYKVASDLETSKEYRTGKDIKYGVGTTVDGNNPKDYLGNYYYTHDSSGDEIVTTVVDQIVDYIDNDIALNTDENTNVENHSWITADIGSDKASDGLSGLISTDSFTDDNLNDSRSVSYFGTNKSNIAISTNNNVYHKQSEDGTYSDPDSDENKFTTYMKDITGAQLIKEGSGTISTTQARYIIDPVDDKYTADSYNPDLTKELEPGDSASIAISVSKTASSGSDSDNLKFDNLAEILVYSNTVGRKDTKAIPGNANEIAKEDNTNATWQAGYSSGEARAERDADATEYVTLTEPTGLSFSMERSNRVLIVTIVAICTMVVAIITVPIASFMYDRSRRKGESE